MDNEYCTSCGEELGESQIGECDSCQAQRTYPIKMIVLCSNGDGPYLHTCEVRPTAEEKEDGELYALAKENAEDNGLQVPMMAFAADDQAASQLGAVAQWLAQ